RDLIVTGVQTCALPILREIRIDMPYDKQGRKFIIQVNGVPVLCKGINWIPLKLFPNLDTKEEYQVEIERIAAANMNMIRVWGGRSEERRVGKESRCGRR